MIIFRNALPFFAILSVVLASACGSSLPSIRPADPAAAQDIARQCETPFLKTPYRLVHSIEAGISGHNATLMGITLFNPATEELHCALLTLEGFVLLEARSDRGSVTVRRSVPPFNSPHFAKSMLEDIRLTFLPPRGRLLKTGRFEDDAFACRYEDGQGTTTDIIVRNGSWDILTYADRNRIRRQIRASLLRDGIPEILELSGFEKTNYTLKMTLISAEPISAETLRQAGGGESK